MTGMIVCPLKHIFLVSSSNVSETDSNINAFQPKALKENTLLRRSTKSRHMHYFSFPTSADSNSLAVIVNNSHFFHSVKCVLTAQTQEAVTQPSRLEETYQNTLENSFSLMFPVYQKQLPCSVILSAIQVHFYRFIVSRALIGPEIQVRTQTQPANFLSEIGRAHV